MPPWQGGGDMIATVRLDGSTWNDLPYKFEAGTPIIAGAIGLGAAVDYLSALGMEAIHAHECAITEYALERLSEVPGLHLLGPTDPAKKGAVAAFTLDGVAVRAGHHCAMPLHEICGAAASARASFYLYNTTAEVDALIEGLYKTKQTFSV
jgi:cysteine desulfurase/selenocysteine lyase